MMASPDTNVTRLKGSLLLVRASSECIASGLATLGSRGDGWNGDTAIIDETSVTAAPMNTTHAAHRHRGPGSSRPSGKNRTTGASKTTPSVPVLLNTQAAHATQLRGDAPLSSPRMAMKSAGR